MTIPELFELLENSTCYGIAYNPRVKECKTCDMREDCCINTGTNTLFESVKALNPETEKAMKVVEEKKQAKLALVGEDGLTPRQRRREKRKEIREKIGMPDTKDMPIDELWKLVEEKGGTCKRYEDDKTQRAQLTKALKKCYIKEYEKEN